MMTCYACGGSVLHPKFTIPVFDGPFRNDSQKRNRTLYQCDGCGHLSADLYDPTKYARHYASVALDDYHCVHDVDRSRYDRILETLSDRPVRRVLDVGCATGTFLNMLPGEVERYGIEPSESAAAQARANGVNIIRYQDLDRPDLKHTFDAVTAIDVVEHTRELQEMLRWFVQALRPGGVLVILTGDIERRSARWLGRFWYYLSYAEHISIFSARSMRAWLQLHFSDITITPAEHHPVTGSSIVPLLRMWLFFPAKWVLSRCASGGRFYTVLLLPGDHMLVRAVRR